MTDSPVGYYVCVLSGKELTDIREVLLTYAKATRQSPSPFLTPVGTLEDYHYGDELNLTVKVDDRCVRRARDHEHDCECMICVIHEKDRLNRLTRDRIRKLDDIRQYFLEEIGGCAEGPKKPKEPKVIPDYDKILKELHMKSPSDPFLSHYFNFMKECEEFDKNLSS